MKEAWAYVDPGSGFVFLQNTSIFWGLILGALTILLLPLKLIFRQIRKFKWVLFILFIIAIIAAIAMNKKTEKSKVIVLGIDALDPNIAGQLMAEGRLRNFSYLKKNGSFSLLKTTNPSESVVAWSSFVTGLNPGGHGIFDFVMRNPKNYQLYLTLDEITNSQGKPKVRIRRKGEAFWQVLSKKNIPSYIYFCPNTFPAQRLKGKMISGMGVTDMLGMMGKFSFYTSKPLRIEDENSRGRIIQVKLDNGIILTYLYGPKIAAEKDSVTETSAPLKVVLKSDEVSIGFQGDNFTLKKGEWSGWKRVFFKISLFQKTYGIVRFYLKNVNPDFELYVSPINFDPEKPLFHISFPFDFSKKLTQKIGLFYTQGMPHDTWALSEGRLDEEAFLKHADIILEEKRKILREELKNFNGGLFFYYFDTLDAIQHMFWNNKEIVFDYYDKINRILGEVLESLAPDTTLIVLSDHGFGPFRRAVHLNKWLREAGLLSLKEDKEKGREFFEDIDWQKTKAYALGFGGIYLNSMEREGSGIVKDSEAPGLKRLIKERLEKWQDLETGQKPIKKVYLREEIFQGPYQKDAPDLFVGFNSGYRASWQTALGGAPGVLVEDNKNKWCGDHLMDPSLVPGVIFVNKKLELKDPAITDIAAIVLNLLDS
jgi:predicted AlkP superfamily phosphohydrolase/phosphomutase